jgi:hypothetical protein
MNFGNKTGIGSSCGSYPLSAPEYPGGKFTFVADCAAFDVVPFLWFEK